MSLCHVGDPARPFANAVPMTHFMSSSAPMSQSPTVAARPQVFLPMSLTTTRALVSSTPICAPATAKPHAQFMPWDQHCMRVAHVFQDASPASSPLHGSSMSPTAHRVGAMQQAPFRFMPLEQHAKRIACIFQDASPASAPMHSPITGTFSGVQLHHELPSPVNAGSWQAVGNRTAHSVQDSSHLRSPTSSPMACPDNRFHMFPNASPRGSSVQMSMNGQPFCMPQVAA